VSLRVRCRAAAGAIRRCILSVSSAAGVSSAYTIDRYLAACPGIVAASVQGSATSAIAVGTAVATPYTPMSGHGVDR